MVQISSLILTAVALLSSVQAADAHLSKRQA